MRKLVLLALLLNFQLKAEIKLPQFFSDGMVLQRDQEVKIWGWGDKNENVTVSFNGQLKTAKANKTGRWEVILSPMRATSDPLIMNIKGENTIAVKDILIGDVWICSGQSNMEWPVSSSNNFEEEIKNANYPEIRIFNVPRQLEFKPEPDIASGAWNSAEGANIVHFSAVGYFFGRHIHESQNIPIGLISSNWGGTTAEAWTSSEKLKPFEYTAEPLRKMAASDFSYKAFTANQKAELEEWVSKNFTGDDQGVREEWYANDYDFSAWKTMQMPDTLESQPGFDNFDGTVWFKKQFILNSSVKDTDLYLRLGNINHLDVVYLNGKEVAGSNNPNTWRSYLIPKNAFNQEGENSLTVMVFNPQGAGGMLEVNRAKFSLSPARWQITEQDISLVGEWRYKVSNTLESPITKPIPLITKLKPNEHPSSLYNGMIHPLIPMAIKGVIWYQGESNARPFDRAVRYEEVFKNMISDWRARWGYNFDFYFVQLANYWSKEERCEQPCEQPWAYLRASQTKTLELVNTGMAVIIDAGDAKDIHPRDKQTVGYRLGLIAEAQTYGEPVVFSGPIYKSHQVNGPHVMIDFEHVGSGLKAESRYGYLNGFQVAGEDQVFYWAKAWIENDHVIVTSHKVKNPVAVRYAWENNPEDANLYNKNGLPASPFRTDDWILYK